MSNSRRQLEDARSFGTVLTDRSADGTSVEAHSVHVMAFVALPIECSGLILDTGDILYDATAWWRWLVQLLGRMGLHSHFPTLYQVWKRDYLCDVNCGRRDYWATLREFLRSTGLSLGQIDEVLIASQPKQRHFQESMRPLPGVKSTLARLASMGMPMGVLSNAPYSRQCVAKGLQTMGIHSYFRAVLSSSDLGLSACEEQCYHAAAEAMCISATELAFVGHDTDELAAAMTAGMRSIAFNYDPHARAHVFLERFDQLIQAVRPVPLHQRAG